MVPQGHLRSVPPIPTLTGTTGSENQLCKQGTPLLPEWMEWVKISRGGATATRCLQKWHNQLSWLWKNDFSACMLGDSWCVCVSSCLSVKSGVNRGFL